MADYGDIFNYDIGKSLLGYGQRVESAAMSIQKKEALAESVVREAILPDAPIASIVRQSNRITRKLGKQTAGASITDLDEIFSTQRTLNQYMLEQNERVASYIDVDNLRSAKSHWDMYEQQLKTIRSDLKAASESSRMNLELVLDSSISNKEMKRLIDAAKKTGERDVLRGHTFALSVRATVQGPYGAAEVGSTRLPFVTGPYASYGKAMNIAPVGAILSAKGLESFPMASRPTGEFTALMPFNQAVMAQIHRAIKSPEWRNASSQSGAFRQLKDELGRIFTDFYETSRPRQRQLSDIIADPEALHHAAKIAMEGAETLIGDDSKMAFDPLIKMVGAHLQDPESALYKLLPKFTTQDQKLFSSVLRKTTSGKLALVDPGTLNTEELLGQWQSAVASKVNTLLSGTSSPIIRRNAIGEQISAQDFYAPMNVKQADSPTLTKALQNRSSWLLDKELINAINDAQKAGVYMEIPDYAHMNDPANKMHRDLLLNTKGMKTTMGGALPTIKTKAAYVMGGYDQGFVGWLIDKANSDVNLAKQWGFVKSGRDIAFTEMRVGTFKAQYRAWANEASQLFPNIPILDPADVGGALGQLGPHGQAYGMAAWSPHIRIQDMGKYAEKSRSWRHSASEIFQEAQVGDKLATAGRRVEKGEVIGRIMLPETDSMGKPMQDKAGNILYKIKTELVAEKSGFASYKYTQGTLGSEIKLVIGGKENLIDQPSIVSGNSKVTTTQLKHRIARQGISAQERNAMLKKGGNFNPVTLSLLELMELDEQSYWRQTGKGELWKPGQIMNIGERKDADLMKGIILSETQATGSDIGLSSAGRQYIAATHDIVDLNARASIQTLENKSNIRYRHAGRDRFQQAVRKHMNWNDFNPEVWALTTGTSGYKRMEFKTQNLAGHRQIMDAYDMWRTEISKSMSLDKLSSAKTTFRDQIVMTGRAFGSEGGLKQFMWKQQQLKEAIESGANAKYLRGAMSQVSAALPFIQDEYMNQMGKQGKVMELTIGGKLGRAQTLEAMENLNTFFQIHQPDATGHLPTANAQVNSFKRAGRALGFTDLKDFEADEFNFKLRFDKRRIFSKDFINNLKAGTGEDAFWTFTRAEILQNLLKDGLNFSSNESFGYSLQAGSFGIEDMHARKTIFNKALTFADLLTNTEATDERLIAGAKGLVEEIQTRAKSVLGRITSKAGLTARALMLEEEGMIALPTQSSARTEAIQTRLKTFAASADESLQLGKGMVSPDADLLKQATTVYVNPEDMNAFMKGKAGMGANDMYAMVRRWPDISSTNQMAFRIEADADVARGKVSIVNLPMELKKGDFDKDMINITLLDTGNNATETFKDMVKASYQNTQREVEGALKYYSSGHKTLLAYKDIGKQADRDAMTSALKDIDEIESQIKNLSKSEKAEIRAPLEQRLTKLEADYRQRFGLKPSQAAKVLRGQIEYGLETGKVSNLGARVLGSVMGEAIEQGLLLGQFAEGSKEAYKKSLVPGLFDAISFTMSEARIREFKDTTVAALNAARAEGLYGLLKTLDGGGVASDRQARSVQRNQVVDKFKEALGVKITKEKMEVIKGTNKQLYKKLTSGDKDRTGSFLLDIGDQAVANNAFLSLADQAEIKQSGIYLLDEQRVEDSVDFMFEALGKRRKNNRTTIMRENMELADLIPEIVKMQTSGIKGKGQEEMSGLILAQTKKYLAKNAATQKQLVPMLENIAGAFGFSESMDPTTTEYMRKFVLEEMTPGLGKAENAAVDTAEKIAKEAHLSKITNTILDKSLVPEGKGVIAGMVAFAAGATIGGFFGDNGELLPPTPIQEQDPSVTQQAITAPPAYLRQQSAIGSRMIAGGYSSNVPDVVGTMKQNGLGGNISVHDNMTNDVNFMYNHRQNTTGRF